MGDTFLRKRTPRDPPDDLPDLVTVICKQTAGEYHARTGMIRCLCDRCVAAAREGREEECLQEPNRWEIHCGMGQAKKWKASVRVILEGHKTMPVGKWLETFGVAVSSRKAPRQARVWGPKRAKLNKMKKKGLLDEEETIYRRLEPMKNASARGGAFTRGPPPRSGKRRFVELIPYVVRGGRRGFVTRGGNNRGGFATGGAGAEGGPIDPERPELQCAVAEGAAFAAGCECRTFAPEESAPRLGYGGQCSEYLVTMFERFNKEVAPEEDPHALAAHAVRLRCEELLLSYPTNLAEDMELLDAPEGSSSRRFKSPSLSLSQL